MESGLTGMGSRSGKKKRAKRQKTKEDECIINNLPETKEDECIINNLPESMISRILSSLPFKDAIRTSVLSRQWICRWTSMAKLDLNDSMFYSPVTKKIAKGNFVNVVNKALLLTKCSSMESFTLNIGHKYDVSLVNTWISSILNRGVKNLCICSCAMFEFGFTTLTSHLLFDSVLLEGLVMCVYRVTISVPTSSVHLGSLKLLKLSGIIFTLNSEDLNLNLPVLKIIEIRNCSWLNAKVVTLNVPLLESISMEHYRESLSGNNCSIKFSAPQLTEFTYIGFGCLSQYIVLLDPSSAHNASTTIKFKHCGKDGDPESGPSASLFLKQFRDVKYLCFDGSKVLALTNVDILPLFGMLSHLELGIVTVKVLLCFLVKSPILKTLGFKGISKFNKEFLDSAAVPECLSSTLQDVKFVVNKGRKHELLFAKFLMENVQVLNKMDFLIHYSRSKAMAIEKFKRKLFSFQKVFVVAIEESPYD